jgi:methyl-accepting chemotaxis protein
MFDLQRLKTRILLSYLVPLSLSLIVAIIVYAQVRQVQSQLELVSEAREIIENLNLSTYGLSCMMRSARGYLLVRDSVLQKDHAEGVKDYQKGMEGLTRLVKDPKQLDSLKKFQAVGRKVEEITGNLILLASEGKGEQAIEMFRKNGIALGAELDVAMENLNVKEQEIMQTREKDQANSVRNLVTVLFSGALLTIVVALAIGTKIAGNISRSLIDAINTSSATANEISATITQHDRTAAMQSSSVNEATATMEELSVSSRQTTDQAQSAAEMARKTSALTEEGTEAVRLAIDAMSGLKGKVGEVAEQILSLSEQTGQIGSIAELVKDLSAQINMLALNAAVEAARAGEHGRGFAVVAAEVRKLSVESRKSAEQARAIVLGIQKATDATIMKTEEGSRSIENVSSIARSVNTLFESISEMAGQVYNSAQQVVLNTRQQSLAIGQVVEAASSISSGVKEMAAGISQTRIGIQNFTEMTEKLRKMV